MVPKDTSPNDPRGLPTLIVGAGLAGLTAAKRLTDAGRPVIIVDKGRSVGGRLATRRLGAGLLDHGAQFFTTRSPEFTAQVASWTEAGVTSEWCQGFGSVDGYPRYRTNGGMNQLAKHLASTLEPELATTVTRAQAQGVLQMSDSWGVSYASGAREVDEAGAIIVTAPVPQAIDLLIDGAVRLDKTITLDDLRTITYHCVVALLTKVDGAPAFGPTGALQQPGDPTFSFVADNMAKGISQERTITFHTSHALSRELFDRSDAAITDALVPKARELLDAAGLDGASALLDVQIKKWRYAGPVTPRPERSITIATSPGPLVLAGDAFAGSKVEGAFLSGLDAAAAVLNAD